jgi:hypothetical protein
VSTTRNYYSQQQQQRFSPLITTTPKSPHIFTIATNRPLPPQLEAGTLISPDHYHQTAGVTDSSLISGIGTRFHAKLHTQDAQDEIRNKPNPYFDPQTGRYQPPLILTTPKPKGTTQRVVAKPFYVFVASPKKTTTTLPTTTTSITTTTTTTTPTTTITTTTTTTTPSPPTTTTISYTLPPNYTEVYDLPENRTRLPTFWNTYDDVNSTKFERYGNKSTVKVALQPIPRPIPLREEFREFKPAGFIFKGYDIHVPEFVVPPQFFKPPKYEVGERDYPVPKDFTTTTEVSSDNSTTALDDSSSTTESTNDTILLT